MDMYGNKAGSYPQKLLVTALEIALIIISAMIMFGPWGTTLADLIGWTQPASAPTRRYLILAFSVIILIRMVFTMFYLMKRNLPWSEAFTVPFAFALYYVGFAVLVLPATSPLGIIDYLAIALFLIGCYLNTGSELQRHRFKQLPENKGKLFTGGLFAWSMHINFFGDLLWVAAYAIITQNIWSALIVLLLLSLFAFFNVPKLDEYLAERYSDEFPDYAARTKKLIPLVW
ncbi:MAG: DUF1295 domain-containing protein [Paracoccaceae bacterium]